MLLPTSVQVSPTSQLMQHVSSATDSIRQHFKNHNTHNHATLN